MAPAERSNTRKETKTMKKNKMMRIASFLLIAVLMTTCAISGTLAKYVTSAESSDTARVAKFGVTIAANGTLFATSYDGTVVSASADDVVAPGTEKSMAKMTLSGTPEVKVTVSYAGELTLTGWEVEGTYYCPLEITVGTTTLKGTSYNSASEFETAVENEIAAYSKTYEAGTNLAEKGEESLAISWKWAFTGNDDVKDTALGNTAATGTAPSVALKVTTTVTQVD